VLERLLEDVSYESSDRSGATIVIDADYVDRHLKDLAQNQDLSRYIL
jgi:ATP-dependent HslUV protease ATP-binding subunit HslU